MVACPLIPSGQLGMSPTPHVKFKKSNLNSFWNGMNEGQAISYVNPKYSWDYNSFKAFFHAQSGVNTKVLHSAYVRGKIKRTRLYFDLAGFRGYLYYNKRFRTDEQALLYWARMNALELRKAILLIRKRKILTQNELIKIFSDVSSLERMSKVGYFGLKRRFISNRYPVIWYVCSEAEADNYVKDELPRVAGRERSELIKKAYEFQNKIVPQLMPKLLGRVPFKTECYRRSVNGNTHKFDIIAYKKIKFCGKYRVIPVVIEVKDYFISSKKFMPIIYFKYKLEQCFKDKTILALLLCRGADKTAYERAAQMNIWVQDVNDFKVSS